ncbi:MAG: 4-alpha-glucanotransferase, partial [Anaerotignum sp.]|nr:4-alpha-glucanotransferase [Anaerotignum sp.]
GTHDNEPVRGWKETATSDEITLAEKYFGINETEGFHWGMIRGGMASVADLFIAQMQDYLGLGTVSRMNTPGTLGGNWQWRLMEGQLTEALTEQIVDLTRRYGRSSEKWQV